MPKGRSTWVIIIGLAMGFAVVSVVAVAGWGRAEEVAAVCTLLLAVASMVAEVTSNRAGADRAERSRAPKGRFVVATALLLSLFVVVAVTADGSPGWRAQRRVLTGPGDCPRALMTTPQGTVLGDHAGALSKVAVSPDGRILASGGGDHHLIRLWNLANRTPAGQPLSGHLGAVSDLAFSGNGELLASAAFDDPSIRVWNPATGKPAGVGSLSVEPKVGGIALSPNGILAVGGLGRITFWDPFTGKQVGPAFAHKGMVRSLAFGKDGKTLVSGSYDGTIRVWDMDNRKALSGPVSTNEGGMVVSVAVSPDGLFAATAGHDRQTVQLLRMPTGQPVGEAVHFDREAWAVAFSPDGRLLAAAGSNKVLLVDVASGQPAAPPMTGHSGLVTTVAFVCDRVFASGGHDGIIRLWRI